MSSTSIVMKRRNVQKSGKESVTHVWRNCLVPLCHTSGIALTKWKRRVATNPNIACPRHKAPATKCRCTELFQIHNLPMSVFQRQIWLDLLQRPKDFEPSDWHGVCSMHFIDDSPNEQFSFPVLYLGLERWQFEQTIQVHFYTPDREKYMEYANMACKDPSEQICWSVSHTSGASTVTDESDTNKDPHPEDQPSTSCVSSVSTLGITVTSVSTNRPVVKPMPRQLPCGIRLITGNTSTNVSPPDSSASSNSIPTATQPNPALVVNGTGEMQRVSAGRTVNYSYIRGRLKSSGISQLYDVMRVHPYAIQANADCSDPACKLMRYQANYQQANIKHLHENIESMKEERRRVEDYLTEAQKTLREQESYRPKCVQCQRVTRMYNLCTMAVKRDEASTRELTMKLTKLEKALFKRYGEERTRLMIEKAMEARQCGVVNECE